MNRDLTEWEYDDGDFIVSVEVLTSAKATLVISDPSNSTEAVARILISPEAAQELADAVRKACEE